MDARMFGRCVVMLILAFSLGLGLSSSALCDTLVTDNQNYQNLYIIHNLKQLGIGVNSPQVALDNSLGDFITNGPYVDARAYNGGALNDTTISAAITAIGSAEKTLLLAPGTWTIANSVTVPANVGLRFEHGAVLSVNGSIEFYIKGPLQAGLYQIFSGTGIFAFGRINTLYPQWFGAKGDGVTDDTNAIQQTFNSAPNSGTGGLLHVHFPNGQYLITNTVVYGYTYTYNGGMITGESGRGSEILYNGPTGNGALYIQNIQGLAIRDLSILGQTVGAFGLQVDASNSEWGGFSTIENVWISNFTDGLEIGHSPQTDVNSMPDMVFKNLLIVGGTNSVETWGSNIDGLAFYGLFTQNSEVAIRCHGMQNLLVNGGGHSNCYDNFIYLQVDGGSVSGVLTLENLRIEQGVTLAWLGSATGNDQKNVDLVVRDVYYPSCRSGVSKTMLIHYGDVGAVTVENSWFLANGCYFHFEDMRTNEYASFNLKNCGLMNSNPEAYDSIVDVSCAGGAGSTGGVNVSMEGNYVMGGTWYNPTSRIVDKSFIVTPANAIAHTETWLLTKDLALVQSARFAGNGVQAVPVGATTVDTSLGNVFATANTAATTITSFINGIASQHVVLLIKDAHTTIQFNGSGNLITIGTSSWTPGTGHWLTADFDGTKWYCTRN